MDSAGCRSTGARRSGNSPCLAGNGLEAIAGQGIPRQRESSFTPGSPDVFHISSETSRSRCFSEGGLREMLLWTESLRKLAWKIQSSVCTVHVMGTSKILTAGKGKTWLAGPCWRTGQVITSCCGDSAEKPQRRWPK